MKFDTTFIDKLLVMNNIVFSDARGSFSKPFSYDTFTDYGLRSDFKEFYYSISKKDVVRGMHFQTPPFEHVKLVYVSCGKILDVVLDIRHESQTYGKCFSVELSAENGLAVYIPEGLAHGFKALSECAIVNYAQTSCYSKPNDCGVRFDSITFDWGISNPILSERDASFLSFADLRTVF